MTDAFAIIVFGWPAIIASLSLALIGLVVRRHIYLFVAAILLLPFTLFAMGYPSSVPGWTLVLPLCLVGSALAIRRQKVMAAWLIFLAPLIFFAWLAVSVLTQSR